MPSKRKPSAPPFTATGDGWVLRWSPLDPYLDGTTPSVAASVEVELARQGRILLTPTGPQVQSHPSNPSAVLAALARVAPTPYVLSGEPPEVPGVPEGAVG